MTTEAKDKTDNPSNSELQRLKEWGDKWVEHSIKVEEELRQCREEFNEWMKCPLQLQINDLKNREQVWHKISDGLPANGLLVNYFTYDGQMGLGYCYMSSVDPDFTPMWSDINDENPIEKNITHWMRVVPPNNF